MTATIKSARKDESDKGQPNINGKQFQRWLVTVANGEQEISTDILRDPNSPDPTGLPAEQKDNGRWRASSQQGGGGSGGGGKYEADSRGLRGKNASSALHAALTASEGKDVSSDAIVALAGKFYDFLESKAEVDGTS